MSTEPTPDTPVTLIPMAAEIAPLPAEDDVLAYTHHHRKELVKALIPQGVMTTDPESQKILLATLSDMDRAALTRKKIKVDEQGNKNAANESAIVASFLQRIRNSASDSISPSDAIPILPADLPRPNLVEGETSLTPQQLTYDSFTAQQSDSSKE